ncbi:MAG: capsid protein [Avonheates virus SG_19]|uniref:capsid protein n=1 Tax=Avonheates virus SG_19 TaxID=2914483 RepID=UPI002481C8CA|nr:MAG: capsid protein [Avonheates virus SG_19]UNI72610.1 MAG: capsid protein [Avonheates virus SG_19]
MVVSNNEVANQLMMVHDPFADTTTQPKIPDGKVSSSLGFSTSSINEFRNQADAESDVMHMLLFAGQNCGLVVANSSDDGTLRKNTLPGFLGSGSCDWSDGVVGGADFRVRNGNSANYALWRVVSQGLQLKLINAAEEDEGWWEAIRLNREFHAPDFALSTTDNLSMTDANVKKGGTCAPVNVIGQSSELRTKSLVDDPSYSTGLLRDLDKVQFELHGRLDFHDFIIRKQEIDVKDSGAYDGASLTYQFFGGHDDGYNVISQFIDPSYDMVYIRLHCRASKPDITDAGNNVTGYSNFRGSRFHTHCISNQEIYFEDGAKENRYQTENNGVGASSMSIHLRGRRASNHAAQLIAH